MSLLDDIGQGFADIPKVIGGSAAGKFLGDAANYTGQAFSNGFQHPWALPGHSFDAQQAPPTTGSADTSGGGAPMAPAGNQAGPQQPDIASSMIGAFSHMANTPAMDPQMVQQAMSAIQGLNSGNLAQYAPVNYLQQAKDSYGNVLGQINGIKDSVNHGYDQAGTDIGDLYKNNQGAMTMGANNILTQMAQNEGNAIQGGAQNNMNALAALKNSELAQRAAVAAQGGVPQAASDNKSDLADIASAGTLANAQQGANNATAAATQNTNLNNEMASALGNQGAMAHQQLENNRLGYNASMGKYMADLANQESTREQEASKQMYTDAMGRVQAGYGMAKDQATLNTNKNNALFGNKGFLGDSLSALGTYNLDNAKAQTQQNQAGNVAPDQTALQAYPQFASAYNKALANGMGLVAGTKPTYADLVKNMTPDLAGSGMSANDLAKFAQMATSPKALNNPYDDLMLAMQGQ